MFRKLGLVLVLILSVFNASYATQLPKEERIPGGLAIIDLKIPTTMRKPEVMYHNNHVLVSSRDNKWVALVGIDITQKPGKDVIVVKKAPHNEKINFTVKKHTYPESKITIARKDLVTIPQKKMARFNHENLTVKNSLGFYNPEIVLNNLTLVKPLQGRDTTRFGAKRIINKIPKAPHLGLDIAAPKGSEVAAAATGIVSAVYKDFMILGNSVVIDHGQGLHTMYSHLDTITVQEKQKVNANDIIGTVGTTGRSTGPHLHFTVSLNKSKINPELFLKR